MRRLVFHETRSTVTTFIIFLETPIPLGIASSVTRRALSYALISRLITNFRPFDIFSKDDSLKCPINYGKEEISGN